MKRKLITTLVAGAIASLCAGPALAQQGKVSDGVVKIGVLTDMSGLYSDLGGKGSAIAAQMAVEDFGGKVLGTTIQVISADHQNKADVGAGKAREWFDAEKVDMITDLLNSGVGIAAAKVAEQKKRIT